MDSKEEYLNNYHLILEKVFKIYQIFVDFFGGDYVDLQGLPTFDELNLPAYKTDVYTKNYDRNLLYNILSSKTRNLFILVRFPEVLIKNEYDESRLIHELYAKVEINIDGELVQKFKLNRSVYTVKEIIGNYMHSHISCIPTSDFTIFQTPCTGRGPINSTIASLCKEFDEDLWMLFCVELKKFVETESITGVPYHRLKDVENVIERINSNGYTQETHLIDMGSLLKAYPCSQHYRIIQLFLEYVLENADFKYSYHGGAYYLGMSMKEFIIKVSNMFIDWYNSNDAAKNSIPFARLFRDRILIKGVERNGKLNYIVNDSYTEDNIRRALDYNNTSPLVCTFHGELVHLSVTNDIENRDEDNRLNLLSPEMIKFIYTVIFDTINYGKTEGFTESSEDVVYI